jgi:hypothetical protein
VYASRRAPMADGEQRENKERREIVRDRGSEYESERYLRQTTR